jgi:hypothetical protein
LTSVFFQTKAQYKLSKVAQDAYRDGQIIINDLRKNKNVTYYENIPEKFKSRIRTNLNPISVRLFVDVAEKKYYYIYKFSDGEAFTNSLGACGKKWVYDHLNRRECAGQGTQCDVLTNPDGSWEVIICE